MPNGKTGDNPFTDITIHGRDVYSRLAAELVRKINALADDKTRRDLADLLLNEYNDLRKPDVPRLERYLSELHETLLSNARDRGFEVQDV